MRKILLVSFVLFSVLFVNAQTGFVFNCSRDTVIDCSQSCITLKGFIPNIHSLSDDYEVTSLNAGICHIQTPSSNVQGTPTNIDIDDRYTSVIPIPFNFPFYGIFYSQLVASSNGIISFDDTNADAFSEYGILNSGFGLGAIGGTPEDLPSNLYDRALIMGPFHDINIEYNTSPNRKIYYQVDGVAPYRRWILAFYEIPLYYTTDGCDLLFKNTHQIILNESTGIIDIYIYDKQICTGWNEGRAMVGLQNYDRDKAVIAPGRAASDAPWGSIGMNEAWRFTPKEGPTLFQRVELLDATGAVVAAGDTSSVGNTLLAVSFPNFCPTASGLYVVKSTYLSIEDPSLEVYGYDTISVLKTSAVPAVTVDTTTAQCNSNGAITVTAPVGSNYEYSIDNGVTYQTGVTFSLPAGHYTVLAREVGGTCTNSVEADITAIAAVIAGAVSTNTSCPGVKDGTISVHVTQGAPVFSFGIDTMTVLQADSVFSNLAAGTHVITVKDNAGCSYVFNYDVNSDPGFTTTGSSTNASCLGIANGSITVTTPTSGTTPFEYSIPGVINAPQTSAVLTGLAGGTAYTVQVEDANGCTYSFSQQVDNSPGVTATDSVVVSQCSSAATGKIFIRPGTGVSPFQFSKDSGATYQLADSFINLLPGLYHLSVRDFAGCIFRLDATVNAGTGVTATDSTVVAECANASTGKIFVKAGAGIAPFVFSKDSGLVYQPADSFINLLPAVYHIAVKDAVGCIYHFDATVGTGTGVTATDSTVVSACAAASTGKIFVKPGLGTGPFTFSRDSGLIYQPADSFINLLPGTYHIAVKDAVGCVYHFNSSVGAGAGVTASDSTVVSACTGVSTGKIFVKPGLGTGPFTFSKDSGLLYQPADSFINLLSGTYHIAVKDAVGCIYHFNSIVGAGAGVVAQDSVAVTACNGVSTGKIFIKATLGSAPFTYSKDSGLTYQAADSFINMAAGLYHIRVRDAAGCYYDFNSTVGTGAGFTARDSVIKTACSTVSTGKIFVKLVPGPGVAPYSFSKDSGVTYQAIDSFTNLAAGIYHVRVRDAVGCYYDFDSRVDALPGVAANINLVNSACAGASTGAIVINTTAGTPGFRYSLNGGAAQTGNIFRNLAANTYTVAVIDTNGCVFTSAALNLANNPGVVTNPSTIRNASCASIPNGSISVNVTAGIAPYTYTNLSSPTPLPQASAVFNGLFSGSYNIEITDSAGCSNTMTSTVGNDPKVKIDGLEILTPSCNGFTNGTITVNVSLGVSPYTFAMDGNGYTNTKVLTQVAAGPHTVHVRDANNCQIDSAILVTEPLVLSSSLAGTTPATCSGAPDGQIAVTAVGGTPPYKYTLDVAGIIGFQSAATFPVIAGSYTAITEDARGCQSTVNALVDSVFTMYLDLGRDTTICEEQALILRPITNAETSVFSYTPSASLDKADVQNPSATPSDTTVYKLTAHWGICSLSDSIKVNVLHKPLPYAGEDTFICYQTTALLHGSASDLSGTVNYLWSPASLVEKADTTVTVALPENTQVYTLTVTDNFGCNFSVTDEVSVTMLPKPAPFAGNDTNAVYGTPHQLYGIGAGTGGSYHWSLVTPVNGSAIISNETSYNATVLFQPMGNPQGITFDSNYYRIALTTSDRAGCVGYDTVKIHIYQNPVYYVPNAFTPNGDGLNDVFRPIPVGITNTEYIRIFNRYGQVVFETSRFMEGWDGTFKGKKQPSGAYIWIIKGKDRTGKMVEMKGTVMLVQ